MSRAQLFNQHRRVASGIASAYYLPGSDRDDIRQEADIALWEATAAWDPARGSFSMFARLYIERRLQSKVTDANRKKRRILTDAARDADLELRGVTDPHEQRDLLLRITRAVRELNDLDRAAIARIVNDIPAVSKTDEVQRYRARRKVKDAVAA